MTPLSNLSGELSTGPAALLSIEPRGGAGSTKQISLQYVGLQPQSSPGLWNGGRHEHERSGEHRSAAGMVPPG
jgi:hypothetical protein